MDGELDRSTEWLEKRRATVTGTNTIFIDLIPCAGGGTDRTCGKVCVCQHMVRSGYTFSDVLRTNTETGTRGRRMA